MIVRRSFTVNNDFKKSSYWLTIIFFLIGIAALVCVSAAKYFQFDELVVTVGQIVSLLAFFVMFINCIYSKSKYNSACIRFADYILTNRKKEAERRAADVERMKEMQNIRAAAEHNREKAVAAALQQGRTEGARAASDMPTERPQLPYPQAVPVAQPVPMPQTAAMPQPPAMQQPIPVQQPVPMQPPVMPPPAQQRTPEPQRNLPVRREPEAQPNEEMLYNEYGEPVMMRRRVRKTPSSPDGEMLYDSNGNPVIRRNQGLWEPLEQRHEFVFKFETAPGMSMTQQGRPSDYNNREGDQ